MFYNILRQAGRSPHWDKVREKEGEKEKERQRIERDTECQ
jgi:hypothetical protein